MIWGLLLFSCVASLLISLGSGDQSNDEFLANLKLSDVSSNECKLTVPSGYSKLVPPLIRDALSPGKFSPAQVQLGLDLWQVSKVDDFEQFLEMTILFTVRWKDDRILQDGKR